MERGPPEDVSFDDEVYEWDDPAVPSSAARGRPAESPPSPTARTRRRARRHRRTLERDLRRLSSAVARRPGSFLAALGAIAGVVLALVLLADLGGGAGHGGGGTEATSFTLAPQAKKRAVPAVLPPGLRKGARGPAVRHLQESLAAVGLYRSAVDGVFGDKTKAAVASFQGSHGLTATGASDPATTHELESAVADRARRRRRCAGASRMQRPQAGSALRR